METQRSNTTVRPLLLRPLHFLQLGVLTSCLLLVPAALAVNGGAIRTTDHKRVDTHFTLTIHDGRLSLVARQASLRAIIDDIGRRMNVEVNSDISAGEKITVAFNQLPLDQALKTIFNNNRAYEYSTVTDKHSGRITKIIVLAIGPNTEVDPKI